MSNGDVRDTLGRVVREAWVLWAKEQPDPKPHWLTPYDELSEADKEADRRIGTAVAATIAKDLYAEGLTCGLGLRSPSQDAGRGEARYERKNARADAIDGVVLAIANALSEAHIGEELGAEGADGPVWSGEGRAKLLFQARDLIAPLTIEHDKWVIEFCEADRARQLGVAEIVRQLLAEDISERKAVEMLCAVLTPDPLRDAPDQAVDDIGVDDGATDGHAVSVNRSAPRLAEVEAAKYSSGTWNNWIAPFHRCAFCGGSLNWQQSVDVFDRPLISASCACGVMCSARLSEEGLEQGRAVDAGNKLAAEISDALTRTAEMNAAIDAFDQEARLLYYRDGDIYNEKAKEAARARLLALYGVPAAPRLAEVEARTNQCDGCREGLPVTDGLHYRDGQPWIGCTASRYVAPSVEAANLAINAFEDAKSRTAFNLAYKFSAEQVAEDRRNEESCRAALLALCVPASSGAREGTRAGETR